MKRVFLILVLFPLTPLLAQTVEGLDERNGFQDIKMCSNIHDYEGLEYKKDIEHTIFPKAKLYEAKSGFYDDIGGLKVFEVTVEAYKDSVYQIKVVVEKDPRLYKGLKKIYGEPKYAYRQGTYKWAGENLRLMFASHSKNKMELTYFSFRMVDKIKEEKKQEVEDIADDF